MVASSGSDSSNSNILDRASTPPAPGVKLLELPAEILANIAIHMDKHELKTFSRLSKQARQIASRYLFASISLGALDSAKMQSCFETLTPDQMQMIKQLQITLNLPLTSTNQEQEAIKRKWLGILLHLIGPNLQNLDLKVALDPSLRAADGPVQPRLESLSLLATAVGRYNVTIDCSKWKGISMAAVWPIFSNSPLVSIPPSQIESLKLLHVDSHFGKPATGALSHDDNFDFRTPSTLETDLFSVFGRMDDLKMLHLQGCLLSTHFLQDYSFKLVELSIDTASTLQCVHNATSKIAMLLVRINRSTLEVLRLRGKMLDLAVTDHIDLPRLKDMTLNSVQNCQLALDIFSVPRLGCLFYQDVRFEPSFLLSALKTDSMLRAIRCIRFEKSIGFSKINSYEYDEFFAVCAARGIQLLLYYPGSFGHKFDIWDEAGHLKMMEEYLRKLRVEITAPFHDLAELPDYNMPELSKIRLSLSSTILTTSALAVNEYALASEYLVPFLEKLDAPHMEKMALSFSTPFIDYLQGFARFISSGAFSAKFPSCKYIEGDIMADTASPWESVKNTRPGIVPKPISVWIKESFVAACQAHSINIKNLTWKNAILVT